MRIPLKNFSSLTYNCEDEQDDLLEEMNEKLLSLMAEFKAKLPHKEGLLLRPQLRKQLKLSHQKKLHVSLKYASELPNQAKRGRKRAEASYRNRVGKKAQALRKVGETCIVLMYTHLLQLLKLQYTLYKLYRQHSRY